MCIESEGEVERKAGESERDEAIRWAPNGTRRERGREEEGDGEGERESEGASECETDQATTIVASVKYCFPCQARRVCTNNDTSINVRIANHTAVY